jgi:hypothetical protein
MALGYIDSGVTENTTYYYKVTAVDLAGKKALLQADEGCFAEIRNGR